jgi:hypothetical protein
MKGGRYTAKMRSWLRRGAGLLVVMVMAATPMVVAACAALCAPPERQPCHGTPATAGHTATAAPDEAAAPQGSTTVPHASAVHSCCADAQARVSSPPSALPADDEDRLAFLPVDLPWVGAERAVDPFAASPPVTVPPGPFTSPLILRV